MVEGGKRLNKERGENASQFSNHINAIIRLTPLLSESGCRRGEPTGLVPPGGSGAEGGIQVALRL